MMKTQSYKKGWAFALTLALVFTTLFGGFSSLGINGVVGEVYADPDPSIRTTTLDLTSMETTTSAIEGWDWNAGTKVLTLSGINLSTASPTGIKVPDATSIVLVGENHVECIQTSGDSSYGIYAVSDLIITGSGILAVTAGAVNNNKDSHGIYVDGYCTINSGTLTASGGTVSGLSGNNSGIYSYNFTINGGMITAFGGVGGYSSVGIRGGSGRIKINGGIVNATGGNDADYSSGLYSATIEVNGGTVNAHGGIGINRSHGIGCFVNLYFNGGTTTATTQADTGTRSAVYVAAPISFGSSVMITQPVGAGVSDQGSPYPYIIATTPGGAIAVTSATIAYGDTTPPTAPTVTGTTPTNDTTPTWSWTAGGGGNGTFRYKLDDSNLSDGATVTTDLSYTSGELTAGTHTLYVQERDAAGNWSTSGSHIIVIDTTPPTAGGGGTITSGTVTANTASLSWTAGTDIETATSDLQYKVVYSTSNNIDTVANAASNGASALDWTVNTISHIVTGLTPSTNYYFNIIVKDEAGNMAVYTTTNTATTALASGSGSSSGSSGGSGSSSGGSGSSGSSSPSTTVINSGTGSITVTQLKNAAGAAKDGGIVTIKSDKTSEVTLPTSGLDSLAGKNNSLTVVTDNGTLTFDSKAVGAIGTQASASDIKVIVDDVVKTTLTEEQQAKVGDKTVYDLSVMSGGKLISSFNGGKVNVSIPYDLKTGETADNVTVWYMADNGSLTEINCTYDAKTKFVTFVVDHFSKYIIGYDDLAGWVNPFTDVKSSAWYYDAIAFVNRNGLMNGQSDTTFVPQTAMTRGMFVTILGRMEGVDTKVYANKITFSDVKSNQYYAPYIAWASDKGIVTGMGGDQFAPNAAVTREQMAVMMTNYMKFKGQGPTGAWAIPLTYGDLDKVSPWANEGVMFMTMKDLMNGMGNDTKGNPLFAPKATSTRAQTAQVMYMFIK